MLGAGRSGPRVFCAVTAECGGVPRSVTAGSGHSVRQKSRSRATAADESLTYMRRRRSRSVSRSGELARGRWNYEVIPSTYLRERTTGELTSMKDTNNYMRETSEI